MLAERAVELEASRTRLITAADEERRRLERDLHDGAQQHLVALSVLIQLARNAEHDRAQPLLTEATELVETRDRGDSPARARHLPAVAGQRGPARTPCRRSPPAPRSRFTSTCTDLGRYPASIEAALYFCCSEALQNAAKHGGPDTTVTITARADAQTLNLTISDTGRGFEPATIGTGLTNMTDRVSAIGGQLDDRHRPGRGTRITAVVNCGTAELSHVVNADQTVLNSAGEQRRLGGRWAVVSRCSAAEFAAGGS